MEDPQRLTRIEDKIDGQNEMIHAIKEDVAVIKSHDYGSRIYKLERRVESLNRFQTKLLAIFGTVQIVIGVLWAVLSNRIQEWFK